MSVRHFEDDISGNADINGNISLPWHGMTGQYASLLLIAQAAAGSPSWTVKINGSPVNVGRGPNSPLSLPILKPGDALILSGSGIQPSGAVTGHFVGYAADELYELRGYTPPQPNTIALDVSAGLEVLLTLPRTPNLTTTKTIPLPANTIAVGYLIRGSTGNYTQVQIVGHGTGDTYVNDTSGFLNTSPIPVLIDPADTSIDVTVVGTALFQINAIDFIAWQTPVPVAMARATIVQEGTNPPLWQAPNGRPVTLDANIGAGGTLAVIAGVGGQVLRLFGLSLTTAAGGPVQLQDTTPTEFGSVAAGATINVPVTGPLGVGLGFQIKAPGAATSVNGIVSPSQG